MEYFLNIKKVQKKVRVLFSIKSVPISKGRKFSKNHFSLGTELKIVRRMCTSTYFALHTKTKCFALHTIFSGVGLLFIAIGFITTFQDPKFVSKQIGPILMKVITPTLEFVSNFAIDLVVSVTFLKGVRESFH